jgi:glycosyltransferase involved in cell wall biosynthesis
MSKLSQGSLLIVGTGEEENNLQALAEKLLPGRHLITSFPYQIMPSIYRSVDLFTFPTVPWESFGIVLVEAMASGLAVVTTDDPIRREIVGEAGLFVNPTNTNEYAKVLKNALAREWGTIPQKQASKFSWSAIALEYEKLFNNLVK